MKNKLIKTFVILLTCASMLFLHAVGVSADRYDEMTAEELYAVIDRTLQNRDRDRGMLYISMDETLTVEEMKEALDALGIPTDFDCQYLYFNFQDNPESSFYGSFTLRAPEALLREYLFALHRSDAVELAEPVFFAWPDEVPPPEGDVNYDWETNAKDYMILKRYVMGTLDEDFLNSWRLNKERIDVNYDGEVNAKDYMMLKRAVMGTYTLGRPAVKDMNQKQLDYWLDQRELHIDMCDRTPVHTVYLKEGATVEDVVQSIGTDFEVLYSSETHYPDYPLWLVIEIPREEYRETVKQLVFSDLFDDWNFWN